MFGAVLAVAFLLTGQYMDKVHGHLADMPDGPRMIYRTRHIFVMFMALLNLGMGTYVRPRQEIGRWFGTYSMEKVVVHRCTPVTTDFATSVRRDAGWFRHSTRSIP